MVATIRPFRNPGSTVFENHRESALQEIRNLENNYILKAAQTELQQHFVEKASLTPLTLHLDKKYIATQENVKYEVSGDFSRFVEPGQRAFVAGTQVKIAIPFEGDVNLLHVRPSRFSLSGHADVEIQNGRILVPFTFPDDSADASRLSKEVERAVSWLNENITQLNKDVANHNHGVPVAVSQAIELKRAKALKAANAVAGLGIPLAHSAAPTFAIPAQHRPKPLQLPKVETGTFRPEPFLPESEYKFILSVTRSMSLVIERSPNNFKSLDEEAIRDHFLIQLNGHYSGSATGETFNAAGKTDILMRYEERNVFIAECKFWKGAKGFSEAIDQLLAYLTWRDCKCALLIFNRNRDSTAVAQKMNEVMQARAEYRKTISHDVQGDSTYIFVKPSEPGREIVITTQLYDIPN